MWGAPPVPHPSGRCKSAPNPAGSRCFPGSRTAPQMAPCLLKLRWTGPDRTGQGSGVRGRPGSRAGRASLSIPPEPQCGPWSSPGPAPSRAAASPAGGVHTGPGQLPGWLCGFRRSVRVAHTEKHRVNWTPSCGSGGRAPRRPDWRAGVLGRPGSQQGRPHSTRQALHQAGLHGTHEARLATRAVLEARADPRAREGNGHRGSRKSETRLQARGAWGTG